MDPEEIGHGLVTLICRDIRLERLNKITNIFIQNSLLSDQSVRRAYFNESLVLPLHKPVRLFIFARMHELCLHLGPTEPNSNVSIVLLFIFYAIPIIMYTSIIGFRLEQ